MIGASAVRLPGFDRATGWLGSPPLTADDLRGKVVLADFWTYTCINWLRTLGYVRAWAERYRDHGLVVVGVHTPEFPFEREVDNVRRAATDLRVDYPIALDSDYGIWDAFANRYWPAVYIAGADGRIRHRQFGEGGYDECEHAIQGLLRDAGGDGIPDDLVAVADEGFEAQADWANVRSPETYVGFERASSSPSREGAALALNDWSLSGDWTFGPGASVLNEGPGELAFRFHARDVNVVLRSRSGTPVPFRVRLDGEPPGAAGGLDVDEAGDGALTEPRLYQLIRQPGPIADRTLRVEFLGGGAEAYVLTFG